MVDPDYRLNVVCHGVNFKWDSQAADYPIGGDGAKAKGAGFAFVDRLCRLRAHAMAGQEFASLPAPALLGDLDNRPAGGAIEVL